MKRGDTTSVCICAPEAYLVVGFLIVSCRYRPSNMFLSVLRQTILDRIHNISISRGVDVWWPNFFRTDVHLVAVLNCLYNRHIAVGLSDLSECRPRTFSYHSVKKTELSSVFLRFGQLSWPGPLRGGTQLSWVDLVAGSWNLHLWVLEASEAILGASGSTSSPANRHISGYEVSHDSI